MVCQLLLVDSKAERAETVGSILESAGTKLERMGSLADAVSIVHSDPRNYIVLAHCDFLNDSFANLARLRQNPKVKILFYSTDAREKMNPAPLIPDQMETLMEKIHRLDREQASAELSVK